jgi:hypothetical protein
MVIGKKNGKDFAFPMNNLADRHKKIRRLADCGNAFLDTDGAVNAEAKETS